VAIAFSGVPAGAITAFQVWMSSSPRPRSANSAMPGTSGRIGRRCALLTARGRNFPSRTCGISAGMTSNIMSMVPARRSLIAGPPPR
jgi:hypothetical protein